jgi:hypothetical protein
MGVAVSQLKGCVMKSVVCAVAAVVLAVPAFACEAPPDVKPLLTGDVKFNDAEGGNAPKAVEIKSADELVKSALFADEAGRGLIKKQVNFDKEKLVVFVWSGSGQDKLEGELVRRRGTARFTYTVGRTDDLRHHACVFAVPKDAKVEMAK